MESTVPRVRDKGCVVPQQYCGCWVFTQLPGAWRAPSGNEHAVLLTDMKNTTH